MLFVRHLLDEGSGIYIYIMFPALGEINVTTESRINFLGFIFLDGRILVIVSYKHSGN